MAIVNFTNIPADFLYEQINKADIILVDLDGVVFTPVQYVCSSYWYVNYIKNNKRELENGSKTALEMVDTLYNCMSSTDFTNVSGELNSILTNFSKSKTIIGLTGRSVDFSISTYGWLRKVGMEFSQLDIDITFQNKSVFDNGIIYVGHDPATGLTWDKGSALDVFLSHYNKKVDRVLFLDDAESNIKSLDKYCISKSLEYLGIHYTKVFDSYENKGITSEILTIIGEHQFNHLLSLGSNRSLMSDVEAMYILCANEDYDICNSFVSEF